MRRSTGAGNGYGKYRYDGHGRRISAWEREDGEWAYRYNAYDASGALVFVVEEENQFPYNDTITHYVKQDGQTVARVKSTSLNSTPEITWLHHDHLGSAVAGTKADGKEAWTERYTPFGIAMDNDAANDNQAGFTGHIKDSDTGLTYMQARYYDPVIGRFLSHDPVQFTAEKPLMFNRYMYASNNPINRIDPDGNTDIYIGGANDSKGANGQKGSHIVKNYAARQAAKHPNRAIAYFSHKQVNEAVDYAKQNSANGEPMNIIGHSWGSNTAIQVTNRLAEDGIGVDNLIGVDPVNKMLRNNGKLSEAAKKVIGEVIKVEGTGAGPTWSNTVEVLGNIMGGGAPTAFEDSNPDTTISSNMSHQQFSVGMTEKGS